MMGMAPRTDSGQDGGGLIQRPASTLFRPHAQTRSACPADVGAVVSGLTDTSTTVTFANLNTTQSRTFVVQGGAYAEHQILSATLDGKTTPINATSFTLTLAPGARAAHIASNETLRRRTNRAFPLGAEIEATKPAVCDGTGCCSVHQPLENNCKKHPTALRRERTCEPARPMTIASNPAHAVCSTLGFDSLQPSLPTAQSRDTLPT